jgi:hypothetical protein
MTGKNHDGRALAWDPANPETRRDAYRVAMQDLVGTFMPAPMTPDAGLPVRRHRASTPARRGAGPL